MLENYEIFEKSIVQKVIKRSFPKGFLNCRCDPWLWRMMTIPLTTLPCSSTPKQFHLLHIETDTACHMYMKKNVNEFP